MHFEVLLLLRLINLVGLISLTSLDALYLIVTSHDACCQRIADALSLWARCVMPSARCTMPANLVDRHFTSFANHDDLKRFVRCENMALSFVSYRGAKVLQDAAPQPVSSVTESICRRAASGASRCPNCLGRQQESLLAPSSGNDDGWPHPRPGQGRGTLLNIAATDRALGRRARLRHQAIVRRNTGTLREQNLAVWRSQITETTSTFRFTLRHSI